MQTRGLIPNTKTMQFLIDGYLTKLTDRKGEDYDPKVNIRLLQQATNHMMTLCHDNGISPPVKTLLRLLYQTHEYGLETLTEELAGLFSDFELPRQGYERFMEEVEKSKPEAKLYEVV